MGARRSGAAGATIDARCSPAEAWAGKKWSGRAGRGSAREPRLGSTRSPALLLWLALALGCGRAKETEDDDEDGGDE